MIEHTRKSSKKVWVFKSSRSITLVQKGKEVVTEYLNQEKSKPIVVITGKSYLPWIHEQVLIHELVFSTPHELLEIERKLPVNTGLIVLDQCEEFFQKAQVPVSVQNQFYASIIGRGIRFAKVLVLRLYKYSSGELPVFQHMVTMNLDQGSTADEYDKVPAQTS